MCLPAGVRLPAPGARRPPAGGSRTEGSMCRNSLGLSSSALKNEHLDPQPAARSPQPAARSPLSSPARASRWPPQASALARDPARVRFVDDVDATAPAHHLRAGDELKRLERVADLHGCLRVVENGLHLEKPHETRPAEPAPPVTPGGTPRGRAGGGASPLEGARLSSERPVSTRWEGGPHDHR